MWKSACKYCLLSIGLMLVLFSFSACNESAIAPGEKTREELWMEDIDFIKENLPRLHPDLYLRMNEEFFLTGLDEIKPDLEWKSDKTILIQIAEVLSKVQDVNTYIYPQFGFSQLPIKMEWFSDGLFVTGVGSNYNYLFGQQVLSIEDTNIDEALSLFSSCVSADNEFSRRYLTKNLFNIPEYLIYLGISQLYYNIGFEFSGFPMQRILEAPTDDFHSFFTFENIQLPLYLQNRAEAIWFEINEEQQYVYIKINDTESDSSVYNSFYTILQSYTPLNATKKVIIDLRSAQNSVNNISLEYLMDALTQYSLSNAKLYTLIDNSTFNCGVDLAYKLKNTFSSTVIGEPTGGRINHSTAIERMVLPNYRHIIYSPTARVLNSEADEEFLEPDIFIELDSEDYFNLKDPLLQYILAQ